MSAASVKSSKGAHYTGKWAKDEKARVLVNRDSTLNWPLGFSPSDLILMNQNCVTRFFNAGRAIIQAGVVNENLDNRRFCNFSLNKRLGQWVLDKLLEGPP